jgi:hypothetical protein
MDRGVDMGTTVDAERKVRDGRGVTSVEMLRLLQLNAGVARIVHHFIPNPDCKVDPPVTTSRSVKNDIVRFHQAWTSSAASAIRNPGFFARDTSDFSKRIRNISPSTW